MTSIRVLVNQTEGCEIWPNHRVAQNRSTVYFWNEWDVWNRKQVRQKIRNRDRVYRIGGDEFAVTCPDLSAQEAEGMIARIALALKEKPVPSFVADGSKPPLVTLSVGIVECRDPSKIADAFARADKAAIESKNRGKDRITVIVA